MGLFGGKKLIALCAGILAMAMGASLRMNAPSQATPEPGRIEIPRQELEGDGRPRWQEVWTLPIPALASASLSPDGAYLVLLEKSGVVRRVDVETGKTLWQSPPYPGVNEIRVTAQGHTLLFSRLNPGRTAVRILDPASAAHSALISLDGAIWCVEPTRDGRLAAVGTGAASLFLIPVRTDAAWPGVPTKLSGIPESLAVSEKSPLVLAGTWMDSGISVWGLDRLPRWRKSDRRNGSVQTVLLAANGETAVQVSSIGPERRDARLNVWATQTGRLLWAENLEGYAPRAAISADGRSIAVSYLQVSPPDPIPTRKIALFDRSGKRLFNDRGGHFFAPELVCLSADGERLTARDEEGNLWTLDRRGRTVSRLRSPLDANTGLPIPIVQITSSDDGNCLLVRRANNAVTLYQAAQ